MQEFIEPQSYIDLNTKTVQSNLFENITLL